MRVYLSGPYRDCTDSEAMDWRRVASERLLAAGIEPVVPGGGPSLPDAEAEAIVVGDKAEIDGCEAVLAFAWKASSGTAMEILYAWERERYVCVLLLGEYDPGPWVLYHADAVARTLEEAVDALVRVSVSDCLPRLGPREPPRTA